VEINIDQILDTVSEKIADCFKNRDFAGAEALTIIGKNYYETQVNAKKLQLTEMPESKLIIEVPVSQVQSAFEYMFDDEAPGQSYTKSTKIKGGYSVSHADTKKFVIDMLHEKNFQCKSTEVAEAYNEKYGANFNEQDLSIKRSGDREIEAWKQRLWSITSTMRKDGIIIGDKNNLYILAPQHRAK
jgi:hypothetical protein